MPDVSRTRLLKVATPLTGVTLVVLTAAKPAGPVATVTVKVEASPVTTFPNASSRAKVKRGSRACPAVPVVGDCSNTNWLADVGLMVRNPS